MVVSRGAVVAIVACSNSVRKTDAPKIQEVVSKLSVLGLAVELFEHLYSEVEPLARRAQAKAEELTSFFSDNQIRAIFDVSGGDLANLTLPYVDFEAIANHPKPYFGFSDNSTVLNAIIAKADIPVCHYFLRTLATDESGAQLEYFRHNILGCDLNRISFPYRFVRGGPVSGRIVGGNLRCLLKLAGTAYMPDPTDRILFLESLGGDAGRTASYLAQLRQLGVFERVRGVLLGNFTQLHAESGPEAALDLVIDAVADKSIPILQTNRLGHAKTDLMCPLNVEVGFD